MKTALAVLATVLLGFPIYGGCQTLDRDAPVPATPAAVEGILAAQPFTLETPYRYRWTRERLLVATGHLVVLAVDPAYVVPRNALEPVLYAGSLPVQRLNHGHQSGRVIGIVPSEVDLRTALIWFGSPELPERVTASMVESERARAEEHGVRALSAAALREARRPPVATKDLASLLREVGAELVYEFSPQEKELADAWRLPVAEAPRKK